MDQDGRKIIHVDMDAFFASVEQRDDPALRGLPVAVGGSRQRGVVAAASYEARKFGVRSAMPSVTARRLCPELVFVPPRFDAYRAVSGQIRDVFAEYTHLIEPLSLDEAYLDVTCNLKGIPQATRIAREIRAAILERTGLTASAGVSYNKFLAKLASDHNKPNGQFTITPDMGPDFVAHLGVGRFHGIGPATAAKLDGLGIRTGADLRERSEDFLVRHFGKAGSHFHRIARGIDNRAVVPDRPRKSAGSETTFASDLGTAREVEAALGPLIGEVWAWRDNAGARGRTVTVKVRYSDFEQTTRSRTVPSAITDRSVFAAIAAELVRSILPLRKPVRLLGVTLSHFDDPAGGSGTQMVLGF